MKYRKKRPTGRPIRKDMNVISRSVNMLPRSRWVAHSARLDPSPRPPAAWVRLTSSALLAMSGDPIRSLEWYQRTTRHGPIRRADRKTDRPVGQCFVLQGQLFARPHGALELGAVDLPASRLPAA